MDIFEIVLHLDFLIHTRLSKLHINLSLLWDLCYMVYLFAQMPNQLRSMRTYVCILGATLCFETPRNMYHRLNILHHKKHRSRFMQNTTQAKQIDVTLVNENGKHLCTENGIQIDIKFTITLKALEYIIYTVVVNSTKVKLWCRYFSVDGCQKNRFRNFLKQQFRSVTLFKVSKWYRHTAECDI